MLTRGFIKAIALLAIFILTMSTPLVALAEPEYSTDGSCTGAGCHTEEELPELVGHSNPATPAEDIPEIKEIKGAEYFSASAKGFGGTVEVTIAVLDGKVVDMIAVGLKETSGIGSNALQELPAIILQSDSLETVDAVAGATVTSKAIMEATFAAMVEAGLVEPPEQEPEEEQSVIEGAEYFTGVARGYGGDVEVVIAVLNGEVADVKIAGENETPGIGMNAIEKLPQAIMAAQDWNVDMISGATITSEAIFTAAKAAFAQAGLIKEEAAASPEPAPEASAPQEAPESAQKEEEPLNTIVYIAIIVALLALTAGIVVYAGKKKNKK